MYSRFSLQTRFSTADAEDVLFRLVDVRDDSLTTKPFVGRLEDGRFKFRRIIKGRNSFLPIINGCIVQGEAGAVVRGTMRLHLAVAVSMAFWMAMAISAVVQTLPKYIANSNMPGAVAVLSFPLFGVVLIAVGYYPERRVAMRLLSEALQ
jgi:hypothetical protein